MKATNPTVRASRRYAVEFTGAMVAYFVVLFGTRWAFASYHGPFAVAIALAPVLPVILVFIAGLRLFKATDEFTQRLMIESLAIAGVITALASVTYGFLEVDVIPRPSAWWVWGTFMFSWAITSGILRSRYQ